MGIPMAQPLFEREAPTERGGQGSAPFEKQAIQSLGLNKQEQALYRRHLANLTGSGGVDNPDGSRSTLFAATFEIEGKTFVIPTVWRGKILKPDAALAEAEKEGLDNFPSYNSEEDAEARYDKMHQFMEKDIKEKRSK